MRNLILGKLAEIKEQEKGFIGSNWENYYALSWHIAEVEEFYPGMPDYILLEHYTGVIAWLEVIKQTGKPPVMDAEHLDYMAEIRKNKNEIRVYWRKPITEVNVQVLGRINRKGQTTTNANEIL